ncbi:uncharacterized protein LOC135693740 [Rhopilema esculentum]|uniref:uncharacterized protein LOC135693740 n=1 Tax=Rhopilema esculentum TaxID=499914 RepID=UPI0031D516B7
MMSHFPIVLEQKTIVLQSIGVTAPPLIIEIENNPSLCLICRSQLKQVMNVQLASTLSLAHTSDFETSTKEHEKVILPNGSMLIFLEAADVEKRIRSLRTQYVRSQKMPSSGRPKRTKRVQWLEEKLQFLNKHVGNKLSISNMQETDDVDDSERISFNEEDEEADENTEASFVSEKKSTKKPTETMRKEKNNKRKREEEEMEVLKKLASSLEDDPKAPKSTPCIAFGKYVGQTLSAMDERTAMIAMNNIQNALFKAQMGIGGNLTGQQYFPSQHQFLSPQNSSARPNFSFPEMVNSPRDSNSSY